MGEGLDDKAARLRQARAQAGYTGPSEAARAMGIPEPTYLAHENASRGFDRVASRYAKFFKVGLEWLLTGVGGMRHGNRKDAVTVTEPSHERLAPASSALNFRRLPRNLPLLGTASCGDNGLFELNDGDPIDYVRRPARLAGNSDAYALYVQGDSMVPWRKNRQKVYVDPRQEAEIGDHVVVQLKPKKPGEPPAAYIKLLTRRNQREVRLEQYNPHKEIVLKASDVKSIHRIVDWDELLGL